MSRATRHSVLLVLALAAAPAGAAPATPTTTAVRAPSTVARAPTSPPVAAPATKPAAAPREVARTTRPLTSPSTPTVAGPPLAPTGLAIAKWGAVSAGGSYDYVGLTWTDNAINETSYIVERWGGPGCEAGYTQIGSTPANATCFEDVGVDRRKDTCWWRVKACNLRGCSDYASISIQNDVQNNPVGGTTTVTVPESPKEKCKAQGGIWLGWGINHCSQVLATVATVVHSLLDPVVQSYMIYFAAVGSGATMRALPEDVIQLLGPYYGETLLREVRYGSSNHTASDNTAMTDCRSIYFPRGAGHVETIKDGHLLERDAQGRLTHESTMRLLLHELQHAKQCCDWGGRENYGLRWFSELSGTTIVEIATSPTSVSSRTIHDAMPMESEAKSKEDLASKL
jgi:hypothetical protein